MVATEVAGFRSFLLMVIAAMLLSMGCVAVSPESDSETASEIEPGMESRKDVAPQKEAETEVQTSPDDPPASGPTSATAPEKSDARALGEAESSARTRAPQPEPTPVPEPEPSFTDVALPAGTLFDLRLLTPLDSARNSVGDEVRARTLNPIEAGGRPVLEAGNEVVGRVTEVQASGKVKGRAKLAFTFDRLATPSGIVDIRTSFVSLEAESGKKKDAAVIGGAAGVGAIVGGIIGGKKGAAIGASIGGAGGTGVVLSTKGEEIRLDEGVELEVQLDAPVTVRIPES